MQKISWSFEAAETLMNLITLQLFVPHLDKISDTKCKYSLLLLVASFLYVFLSFIITTWLAGYTLAAF